MVAARNFTHERTRGSDEWYTPREVFKALPVKFDVDPCSPGAEIVPWIPAKYHITLKEDGLKTDWSGRVWMNPPYGNQTEKWMQRLLDYGNGIALLFARTDTIWFHKFVPSADAICFVKGRLRFIPIQAAEGYANQTWNPRTDTYIDVDGKKRKTQPGSASIMVAYGRENAESLFELKLGLTLPVSKVGAELFRPPVPEKGLF